MNVYYIGDCGHFVFLPNDCQTCKNGQDVFATGMVTVQASYLHELELEVKRLKKAWDHQLNEKVRARRQLVKERETRCDGFVRKYAILCTALREISSGYFDDDAKNLLSREDMRRLADEVLEEVRNG